MAGGSGDEDVELLCETDHYGQDQEGEHQRDTVGWRLWRECFVLGLRNLRKCKEQICQCSDMKSVGLREGNCWMMIGYGGNNQKEKRKMVKVVLLVYLLN